MQAEVAALLSKRDGHWVFESGHHGDCWADLERLCLRPERVLPLAAALADRLRAHQPTAVCAPLVEGAFVGLLVASSLRVPFTYSAPTREPSATGLFPVAYAIPTALQTELRAQRVAIVNDVVNAGSSVRGTLQALAGCEAQPVAIGTLAILGNPGRDLAAAHGIVLETLATFPNQIWEPGACPLCERGVPLR